MPKKKKEEVAESNELLKVKVIKGFYDKTVRNNRVVGDVFEVDEERYKELAGENRYETVFVKKV